MLTILASFAQEESLSVSENCKWRIQKRFESGDTFGFFGMYGYDYEKGVISINEEQATVVRQIFDWYIGGHGTGKIAKLLNEQGISSYRGGRWGSSRVGDLLQNEKVTGNAMLQKSFTIDHLTKKKKCNRGEKPRWFAEDTHPAIISTDTFETARRIRQERAAHVKAADTSQNRYPFSGKIVCQNCGKNYRRKVVQGRHYWQCGTFLADGRDVCPAKQIPEQILMSVTSEVLGLPVFDDEAFKEKISEVIVPSANRLTFIFFDGRIVEREWLDRSRRESWTDEMKETARQRQFAINEGRRTNG